MVTVRQFLRNPVGSGSANVARRDRIAADLNNRFRVLYKVSKNKFSVKTFIDPDTYDIYYKLTIPSEQFPKDKLVYDVIIKLVNGATKSIGSLRVRHIQVFSNSPGFTYTYAYVFNKYNMVIDWTKPKIAEQALQDKPLVRNPNESLGFEKSVYFSLLYLTQVVPRLLQDSIISKVPKLDKKAILKEVASSEGKAKEYQILNEEVRTKKKKAKERSEKISKVGRSILSAVTLGRLGQDKKKPSIAKPRKPKPVKTASRKTRPTKSTKKR